MSNLEDRQAAQTHYIDEGTNTPKYPNLGAAVAKHRRLNDDTPEGRKAYGQAVHAAIRALQRSALNRELPSHQSPCASGTWHSEGKDILKAIRAQHRTATQTAANGPTFERTDEDLERDYYRALFASRGIDVQTIIDLANAEQSDRISTWLQAAWNVIKTKRGTPYLVEAKAEPDPTPDYLRPLETNPVLACRADDESKANVAELSEAEQRVQIPRRGPPKKRGRPFGSKNKPKLVAEPVKPAEQPKPSKPRVPSHYLSSASSVAYHAAM
jgi:hypothetical protein